MPRRRGNRQGHIQTMITQTRFSFLARSTACNKTLNITAHPRPKEVVGQHLMRFEDAEVTHGVASMSFLQQKKTNRTNWNAQLVSTQQEPILHMKSAPRFALFTMQNNVMKISIIVILIFQSVQTKDFKV